MWASAGTSEGGEELAELKDMLNKGLITRQDYDDKKKQLLEGIKEEKKMCNRYNTHVLAVAGVMVLLAAVAPVEAQSDGYAIFDKFNFKAEFSWVDLSTEIRVDSDLAGGRGTTLNFENDLGLGGGNATPSLDFEWQIGKRHRLAGRWQEIDRKSSAQALTEIHWGDDVIPIDADINLGFDISQFFIDYTFYPWVKERWAAGFGIGFRWMDIEATLSWDLHEIQDEGSTGLQGSAPLPYLYFEYRRMFSEHWRFIAGVGVLYIEIGDIKGGQAIGRASIEYLLGRRWSVGGALNLSTLDVEWKGLDDPNGDPIYTGKIIMDINDFSIFARVRF